MDPLNIIPGVRTINFAYPVDNAHHDRMVSLVTQMLDLNRRLQDAIPFSHRTMTLILPLSKK
jgi:hypothetical protein